ncbi:putative sulfate exporter family transporter [Phenylobacterium sp. LjRoot225]|uniref:YeiH family protein n=1 Tax=Phenylobacterium sp. LjRoot225 TaxID=3342285 RepID=UPI003ECED3F0
MAVASDLVRPGARLGGGWLGGLLLCGALALAATLAAPRLHLPAMLLVLLLGAGVRGAAPGLADRCAPGIGFCARVLLRWGVALLGLRIVAGDLAALGWRTIALVFVSLLATLVGGYAIARRAGALSDTAAVCATSVAVCGASAAVAAAAMAPRREGIERDTAVVILVVSLLSTAVMVLYPPLCHLLGYDARRTSLVLGAAIHDVAQVVGAGFAVSPDVGLAAVTIKLVRVACLMPVCLVWGSALAHRRPSAGVRARERLPAPPMFLMGFFVLAAAASLGWTPAGSAQLGADVAAWCLAAAVAAIGLKTSASEVRNAPKALIWTLVATTLLQLTVVIALTTLLFP